MSINGFQNRWHRPDWFRYSISRISNFVLPPIEVHQSGNDVTKEEVAVAMPDGDKLCLNFFRQLGAGKLPTILSASPYGKAALPKRKGDRWSLSFQFRIMNQPSPIRISDQTSWDAPILFGGWIKDMP